MYRVQQPTTDNKRQTGRFLQPPGNESAPRFKGGGALVGVGSGCSDAVRQQRGGGEACSKVAPRPQGRVPCVAQHVVLRGAELVDGHGQRRGRAPGVAASLPSGRPTFAEQDWGQNARAKYRPSGMTGAHYPPLVSLPSPPYVQ